MASGNKFPLKVKQHRPPQLFHTMAAFEKGAKLQEQRNELAAMLRKSNGGNEKDPQVDADHNIFAAPRTNAPSSATAAHATHSHAVPANDTDDHTTATSVSSPFSQRQHHRPRGLRPDYRLGDEARSASHMLVESNPFSAFQHATSLHDGDYAFVKRSDGKWTYAVLGHRSLAPSGGGKNDRNGGNHYNMSHPSNYHQHYHPRNDTGFQEKKMEECMVFILNEKGSTKQYKKRQFGEEIRMVSMKGLHGSGNCDASSCAGSVWGGGSVAGGSVNISVAGSVGSNGRAGGSVGPRRKSDQSDMERKKSSGSRRSSDGAGDNKSKNKSDIQSDSKAKSDSKTDGKLKNSSNSRSNELREFKSRNSSGDDKSAFKVRPVNKRSSTGDMSRK